MNATEAAADNTPRRIERSTLQQPLAPPGVAPAASASEGAAPVTEDPAKPAEAAQPIVKPGFVRRPFGSHEQKLSADRRPGYHRHWFNDTPGRIKDALAAGYSHVKEGKRNVSRVVGVKAGGNGELTAFLMEIPQQFYEEDMRAQEAQDKETERAIRGGDVSRKDKDERYIPKSGIKFEA